MASKFVFLFVLIFFSLCRSIRDPLWDAVFEARVDVVDNLIENHMEDPHRIQAGVFPTDVKRVEEENGRTALFICGMKDIDKDDFPHRQKIDKACTSIAKTLQEAGADMNHIDNHGTSVLSMAALRGFTKLCKYLLHKGANINQADENGLTPLHKAVGHGYIDTASMLVQRGASLAKLDSAGKSPLVTLVLLALADATFHEHLRKFVSEVIVPAAAENRKARKKRPSLPTIDIDHPRDLQGRSPLHYAVIGKSIQVARILIDYGADPAHTDDFGVSTLNMVRETESVRKEEMLDLIREGMVRAVEAKHELWLADRELSWKEEI